MSPAGLPGRSDDSFWSTLRARSCVCRWPLSARPRNCRRSAIQPPEKVGYFNTIEDLGFFKNDRTDIRIFQTQHTRQVVAVEWSVGIPADTAITAP
jgi:hypothetical protein